MMETVSANESEIWKGTVKSTTFSALEFIDQFVGAMVEHIQMHASVSPKEST